MVKVYERKRDCLRLALNFVSSHDKKTMELTNENFT